jgi:Spy/CpxP family protein refolding chaperone
MHSLTMLGLALALPAMAQTPATPAPQAQAPMQPMQQQGRSWDKMMGRMAEKLNLTDAQKASCKDIVAKHKDSLKAKGQAARGAFFEAVQKPETTPDTLKALNRTAADTRIEALLEGRAMRQELRAVLTPDQREKAAYIMGRRAGMHMGRGWGWDGRADMRMGGGKDQCPCAPAKAQ